MCCRILCDFQYCIYIVHVHVHVHVLVDTCSEDFQIWEPGIVHGR